MDGRFNVSYNDINELAYPVLRHRLKLTFEAVAERVSADDIIKMIVAEVSKKYKLSGATAVETTVETVAETEVAATETVEETKKSIFSKKSKK